MANEISQSIFVSDIKVNILDYKCAENLFAFTHSILCGGDGDVKDHVYHCVLILCEYYSIDKGDLFSDL